MYCQAMAVTVHVLSAVGRESSYYMSAKGVTVHVLSGMAVKVHVLSAIRSDSSCAVMQTWE